MKKKKILFILVGIFLLIAPAVAQQATQTAEPEATVAATTAAMTGHWWNERVFYELFVRSFYDSNGDGKGDLQGVIQKLDYLNDGNPNTDADLGVTGIWLMPIMASPSYHGYDVTDFNTVNPDYGTNDDFKQLISEAHKRGIAVIVDLPVNHTSNQNSWFKASAAGDPTYADWYIWKDKAPSYRGPFGEQVWFPLGGRFYYAIFCDCMPDLNYTNPAVTAAMDDVAKFWLTDMGADGLRLDALQHIIEDGTKQQDTPQTRQWAAAFHQYVKSVAPNSLTVGEVNNNRFVASAYVPNGADLDFEFDLADAMVKSANSGRSDNVVSIQNSVDTLYPPGQYAAFLTNHDQNRLMNDLGKDANKAKVAADLLMTQPGVPFVYYGEEIGMQGAKPDEEIRTPMQWDTTPKTAGFTSGTPWEAPQNDTATVNVATEDSDPNSLLNHYRDLIHLREAHPALEEGKLIPVTSASHNVYSFVRQSDSETLLVVINLSNAAVSDYGLTLKQGLSASQQGSLIEGTGDLAQPQIDANGGFSNYLPLAQLPPDSLTIIRFG